MRLNWPVLLVVSASLLLVGASCGTSGTDKPDQPPSQSVVIDTAELSRLPYEKGEIVILGTPVPVTVKVESKEDGFSIISLVEGSPYEEEHYTISGRALRFAGTDAESFTPPIPLTAQPFEVPGSWTWTGKMKFAGKVFEASADAKSSRETLNLPGGPFDCVRIDLDLLMKDPSGSMAKRKLNFWLTEEDGIVKREFASSSTRQPVGSTDSES